MTAMFNIDARPTFKRPVTVRVPSGDGYEEQTFTCEFVALDNDEISEFDLSSGTGTTALLKEIIVSFEGLIGKDGPVHYSTEIRDRMLRKHWVRVGLMNTYTNSLAGVALGN